MPPLVEGEYLTDTLMDVGPAIGGMSIEGVSYAEIEAWTRLSQTNLAPWASKVLRSISKDYAAEYSRNVDQMQTPPWLPEVTEDRARTIAKKAMMVFS